MQRRRIRAELDPFINAPLKRSVVWLLAAHQRFQQFIWFVFAIASAALVILIWPQADRSILTGHIATVALAVGCTTLTTALYTAWLWKRHTVTQRMLAVGGSILMAQSSGLILRLATLIEWWIDSAIDSLGVSGNSELDKFKGRQEVKDSLRSAIEWCAALSIARAILYTFEFAAIGLALSIAAFAGGLDWYLVFVAGAVLQFALSYPSAERLSQALREVAIQHAIANPLPDGSIDVTKLHIILTPLPPRSSEQGKATERANEAGET